MTRRMSWSPALDDLLVAMRRRGWTLAKIAGHLGGTVSAIRCRLHTVGVQAAPVGDPEAIAAKVLELEAKVETPPVPVIIEPPAPKAAAASAPTSARSRSFDWRPLPDDFEEQVGGVVLF